MFPNVPLHAILIDLMRTYSVDATIQNIITDNIIQFPLEATAPHMTSAEQVILWAGRV